MASNTLENSMMVRSVGGTAGEKTVLNCERNCLWMAWMNMKLPKTASISVSDSMGTAVLPPLPRSVAGTAVLPPLPRSVADLRWLDASARALSGP